MDKEEKVLSKVLRRLRPYWALLVGTILLAGVNVAIGLYIPILVGPYRWSRCCGYGGSG